MAKKAKAKKASKKRADKYQNKLQVNATFEQPTKALVTPKQPAAKK